MNDRYGHLLREAQRSGMHGGAFAGCPPARRHGVTAMHQVAGLIVAIVLALLLFGTATGRDDALAWIYLQSTQAMTNATHLHAFPLDRLDPTCPQCM
jgi:hypothetical protein